MADQENPLLVAGKTERCTEVKLDVRRMCADNSIIHGTFAKAFERLFEQGFPATYVIQLGIVLKDSDGLDTVAVTAFNPNELDIEPYLVDFKYGFEAK